MSSHRAILGQGLYRRHPEYEEKVKQISDVATEQLTPVVRELREYRVILKSFSGSMGENVFPHFIN